MTRRSRVRQVVDYLRPDKRKPPTLPADVAIHLSNGMLLHFGSLTAGDQRHLIAVYRELEAAGAAPDTCIAGLLHDVGKADGICRVSTCDRIVNVLLKRYRPGWLVELARRPAPPRLLHGLYLAARHAELGANLIASCGYNDRIVWLVRHHEERDGAHDGQLALLIAADDAADSSSSYYT